MLMPEDRCAPVGSNMVVALPETACASPADSRRQMKEADVA
jgi:hypothetical protein